MRAMKGLSMNKMLGGIKRKPTAAATNNEPNGSGPSSNPGEDTPESIASRNVRQFCESGGRENAGDEVTFLPAIVDAAESSPAAAAECARIIRKYLHKDFWTKPSFQYNAIMLMRILADNPGATFTRSIDKKFVDVAKELLRYGRDPSVRQMLMETLDAFEAAKGYDEGLGPILEMWRKEKEKAYKVYGVPPPPPQQTSRMPTGGPGQPPPQQQQQQQQPYNAHSQNYFARSHRSRQLPEPIELANRLEEARTSAKLLQQVVACTPPAEVLENELIKEFADRCLSASRSIQGYMKADSPGPDNDTMESLIDTNEQLQSALNQHQRAVLNARKHLGLGNPQPQPQQQQQNSPRGVTPPGQPPARSNTGAATVSSLGSQPDAPSPLQQHPPNGGGDMAFRSFEPPPSRKAIGKQVEPAVAGPSRSASVTPRPEEDPFADPVDEPGARTTAAGRSGGGGGAAAPPTASTTGGDGPPRLALEPFHPGGFGGSSDASPAPAAEPAKGRTRGMTQSSEDLYGDSDDDRKARNQQPVYRY